MNVILQGIVGSTAYGLAHAGSDVDRLGVFLAPTEEFLGLTAPAESVVEHEPDRTVHELGKWIRLALGCNPTVLELAWLPAYEIRTPTGDELIANRAWFGHAEGVRKAFLGYATQQFRRLENRGDGSFSSDTRKRTAKHARHLARLVEQGREYYRTGELTIRLADPERIRDVGERVADGDLDLARNLIADAERDFDAITPALPREPDTAAADAWLRKVRLTAL